MEADQKGEKGESKGSKEVPSLQTPEAYWSQLLQDWQSNLNGNNGQSALSPAHLSALSRSPQLAVCRSYANLMRIWTLQCKSDHVVMAFCVIIWCRSTWSHPDVCTLQIVTACRMRSTVRSLNPFVRTAHFHVSMRACTPCLTIIPIGVCHSKIDVHNGDTMPRAPIARSSCNNVALSTSMCKNCNLPACLTWAGSHSLFLDSA